MEFRRATAADRQLLDDMTLTGVRYWGHDVNHPEAFRGLVRSLESDSGPENYDVHILEEYGRPIGFFDLRDRGGHVELVRMFLRTDLIGQGFGKALWTEATRRARETYETMLIMSDPGARGFYEAMGAQLEADIEASPGFVLGKYWYQLNE